MDIEFTTLLSICIIPQIISLIIDKEDVDEDTALKLFYESTTYVFLSKEDTKVWHYSSLMLYHIWKKEKETGEVNFPDVI